MTERVVVKDDLTEPKKKKKKKGKKGKGKRKK